MIEYGIMDTLIFPQYSNGDLVTILGIFSIGNFTEILVGYTMVRSG